MQNDIGPRPADSVEAALWDFTHALNPAPPYHPLDVDRFYEFIVIAHRQGSSWNGRDVESRLLDYRAPNEAAREFAKRYEIGRNVLLKQQRMENGDVRAAY